MKRRLSISLTLVILLFYIYGDIVLAFPTDKHNPMIEGVLFGEEGFSDSNVENPETVRKTLDLIETAVYLCIDQHNAPNNKMEESSDSDKLKKLINQHPLQWRLLGLVEKVSDINVGGKYHRKYTHKGWNYDYSESGIDKAHWEKRKEILLATVTFEFGFKYSLISKQKWDEQCDAFCRLLYYTHVLGDHQEDIDKHKEDIEAKAYFVYSESSDMMGIADIIGGLINCGDDLFIKSNQEWKTGMKPELEKLQDRFYKFKDIIKTKEDFDNYCNTMDKLWNILNEETTKLLNKEDFFKNTIKFKSVF